MSDDELMLNTQLTPKVRPFVDFAADFSGEQGHRGWNYGYIDLSGQDSYHQVCVLPTASMTGQSASPGDHKMFVQSPLSVCLFGIEFVRQREGNMGSLSNCFQLFVPMSIQRPELQTEVTSFVQEADLEAMQELEYFADPSGQAPDGEWRSMQSKYPNLHRYILHPCAGWGRGQCAGVDSTAAVLRFKSYLSAKQVVFVLVYEVRLAHSIPLLDRRLTPFWCRSESADLKLRRCARLQVFPRCGDGVAFEVKFTPMDAFGEPMLMHREDHGTMQKPLRQRLHFFIDQLEAGDMIDLVALPKKNHDCDGVLLLEAQLWDSNEYSG